MYVNSAPQPSTNADYHARHILARESYIGYSGEAQCARNVVRWPDPLSRLRE